MEKIFRTIVAIIIIVVIGIVTLFEVFSFRWSIEDMSTGERIFGAIMMVIAVPLCFWVHGAICKKKGDK
jgi:hypothetical protein